MPEEFKRLKRELKFKGAILDFYQDTMQIPNGNIAIWDFIHHKGAAAVIPVMEDGRIIMVRQYRNALDRYTLEIPAGARDAADEPTINCASRELEEETGYRSDHLEHLLTLRSTVAFCDELIDVYVARDLIPTKQHLDENEYVELEIHSLEELMGMVFDKTIQDAKTVSAIMAYYASVNQK